MIIVEYAEDRCSLNMANVSADVVPVVVPVASPVESADHGPRERVKSA
jgi:hypothetical protein